MIEFSIFHQSQEEHAQSAVLNGMPVLHYQGIKKFEYDPEKGILAADEKNILCCTKIMILVRAGYRNETIIQLELEPTEGVYSYVGFIADEALIHVK